MTSKTIELTPGAYIQLDTGVDTAVDAQNISAQSNIKLIFAVQQPQVNDTGYYLLSPREAIPRNGKTGLMWALALGPNCRITVGE